MRPFTPCTKHQAADVYGVLPKFWHTQFSDLITRYGEEEARRILRTMERAYEPVIRDTGREVNPVELPD